MSVRVKVCGMRNAEDVAACVAAGVDALGFIFAKSPRRLSVEQARVLTAAAPPLVTTVGVFANDSADLVRDAFEHCRLDVLQFSGDEAMEFCGSFGKPTIVAARGRHLTPADLEIARAVGVLVDSWSATEFGGTGRVVDAAAVSQMRAECGSAPVILAGGLTPDNVAALIRASKPDAVDVRTGVERDGRKDAALVRAFVAAARTALTTE
jgi:phosphoribosylanthranilate isomerase